MITDGEHLLLHLLASCLSSLGKMSVRVFCPFSGTLFWVALLCFDFGIELGEFLTYLWILAHQIPDSQAFSPSW